MLGKITAVAAASLAIGTLALPGTVFAHSNHVRANCNIGVNVEAHDYPNPQGQAGPNSVTVEYDGQVTSQLLFGPSIKANAPNPDKTVAHLYVVTFDRFNYVGPDGDTVYTGTIPACAPATTSTTTAVTTTVPAPTTTAAEIPCVDGNFAGTNNPCSATDLPPVPPTTVATFVCAGVIAADVCIVPTTTVAPASHPSSLPSTGSRTDIELAIALSALAIGWCLLSIRRSRA